MGRQNMNRTDHEHEAQCAVFQWATLMEGRYPALRNLFAIPNGGHRDVRTAAKMQREGLKAGVPDMFLAQPRHDPISQGNAVIGYETTNGLFIELKRPTLPGRSRAGVLSPVQKEWLQRLEAAGYRCVVALGSEDAIRAIKEYLGIK